MPVISWNDDLDAQLRRLWATGKDPSDITRMFPGKTEFAILSRATRLGLPKRKRYQSKKALAVARKTRAPVKRAIVSEGISWITAPRDACVNVLGDPRNVMICGKPRVNENYCVDCTLRMTSRAA